MTDSANLPENQKIVLLEYPEGVPTAECMGVETEPTRAPDAGEVVIKNDSVSIDAWIATTMSKGWLHEFMPLGGTVAALGVGHVVASNFDGLAVGDAVTGPVGAQTYTTLGGEAFQKVDESIAPLSAYLGLLSMTTGLTAYFGILEVGDVKEGETVVVSAAAGAVGTVVGQMAKIKGARVIGIAGGPAKCKFLTEEVGFDEAIDYKGESIDERLKALAPDGIDVFFDNVGGEMLDEVLEHIRERARVVICGAISQYDDNTNVHGPRKYLRLAERYARMEGFTVFHFMERYPEAYATIGKWIAEGKIYMPEQIEEGIESFPKALSMLFTGGNTGKLLVKF